MDARHRGRDVSLPVTLILVGLLALWLRGREGDWTLWRLLLLLIPVFVLSVGVNLAAEHRRMAAAVAVSAAGIALLAQGLGLVDWSAWGVVAKAWPLAVVALGLDLVLDRTSWPRLLLASLAGVAIVVGAVLLLGVEKPAVASASARHLSHATGEAKTATITLRPALGSLELTAATEPASLLELDVSPDPGDSVVESFEVDGDRALVEVRLSDGVSRTWPGLVGRMPRWEGRLATGVVLSLHVNIGVGSCNLDLTDVEVHNLEVKLGLGECTVHLPPVPDLLAKIDSGIGQTTLVLPEAMEARVRLDTGLATTTIDDDLSRVEDEVFTPGYSQATSRAEIRLDQGIGSVVISRR